MLTDSQDGKRLLNEVAYRIVSETAPEEIPIYVETRDQYFADPAEFVRPSQSQDEALAIGEVLLVKTFIKVVFPLLSPILQYLLEAVAETLQEEIGEEATNWIKQLFESKRSPKPIFTQAELEVIAATISEISSTEANRLGLEPQQAQTVSDAVIARLALAKR